MANTFIVIIHQPAIYRYVSMLMGCSSGGADNKDNHVCKHSRPTHITIGVRRRKQTACIRTTVSVESTSRDREDTQCIMLTSVKYIENVWRCRDSRTAKSKKTSRDDGIKQFSIQPHLKTREKSVGYCILIRTVLCHHPCLFLLFEFAVLISTFLIFCTLVYCMLPNLDFAYYRSDTPKQLRRSKHRSSKAQKYAYSQPSVWCHSCGFNHSHHTYLHTAATFNGRFVYVGFNM